MKITYRQGAKGAKVAKEDKKGVSLASFAPLASLR